LSTFISYSRANAGFAIRLAKDLKSAEYDVWLDQLDIPTGVRWDDEIEMALANCTTFMIILSPESMQSQNVKDEIGYAIDAGKNILPLKIKSGDIPLRLRRFQYVDFTTQSYEKSLKEIKNILPKKEHFLTTIQIQKRLGGEETLSTVEETGSPKSASSAQPTIPRPKRPEGIAPPARRRPISKSLWIAVIAIVGLVIAGIILSVIRSRESSAAPTTVPTVETLPTAGPTANPAVDTTPVALTPEAQSEFFTMKFANENDLNSWEPILKGTGRADKITISSANDGLIFNLNDADLGAYYFYKPNIYENVTIRWKAENLGKNTFNVGVVCRRSGNKWYEFRITGEGLWYLYKYDGRYLTLDSGGAMAIKPGINTNEYEMLCVGNQISLRINDETVKTFDFKTSYYAQGQVGFSILSRPDAFPMNIRVIEFEVSKPKPG
jgi:hypothetical protein